METETYVAPTFNAGIDTTIRISGALRRASFYGEMGDLVARGLALNTVFNETVSYYTKQEFPLVLAFRTLVLRKINTFDRANNKHQLTGGIGLSSALDSYELAMRNTKVLKAMLMPKADDPSRASLQ